MNKAYKFRIKPNVEQKSYFSKTFGCVRFVYNKMLEDKIEHYKETNKTLQNTPAQYKKEFRWLSEVDSLALANAQLNLRTAYNNFFRNKSVGFPKFKSKNRDRDSYTTNNQKDSIRVFGKHIKLPKIGLVRIKQHRQIRNNEVIKSCTISKTPTGKYYISILVTYEESKSQIKIDKKRAIGLDYSMSNLYVDSNNNKIEYPRFYRVSQSKLSKRQRIMSKCVRGSSNYYKARMRINLIYEKIANQRKDFLHKLSKQITNVYDVVCVEDLNMKAMSQCLNFGKSVMDNGWGMFINFLEYKSKRLVKIDKWYPSSKTCNICGFVNQKLELGDREWICEVCKTSHHRDYNAAINIKHKGLESLSA